MRKVKKIFFDLGGVVFEDPFSTDFSVLASKLRVPADTVKKAYTATDATEYSEGRMSDEDRWRLFVGALSLPETRIPECIAAYRRSYSLIEPTITFLQQLQREYPTIVLGVISNQPTSIIQHLRDSYTEVFTLFDPHLTLISAEVGLSKLAPNLDFYTEAVQRAGLNPASLLFVDDSQMHLANAAKVGMLGFWFDRRRPREKLLNELRQEIARRW